MAESMSNAELQGIVVSQQRQLDALAAQGQREVVATAIAGALGTAGVELVPGSQHQLTELLKADVQLVNHGGQLIPAGPGLKPVDQYVREQLGRPEYAHFVRGKTASPATGNQAGIPPADLDSLSMGERVIRATLAARPDHTRPASEDMSQSFGLPSSRRK
jgi:hypothetical protein